MNDALSVIRFVKYIQEKKKGDLLSLRYVTELRYVLTHTVVTPTTVPDFGLPKLKDGRSDTLEPGV